MTEAERREMHELIAKVADGDKVAALAVEVKILAFEKAKAIDDTVYAMDRLALLGLTDLHERISTLLQSGIDPRTDDRPPWIA